MRQYRYGGFWRRGVALFIDNLILNFIFYLLVLLELQLPLSPYGDRPGLPAGFWGLVNGPFIMGHFAIFTLISVAYFTYFHGAMGQTPGKILLQLKVIRKTGKDLTYGIAFLRWLGYIISGTVFYLGFIWAAFDGRKQGWHDKIAGTLVVRTGDREPRASADGGYSW